MKKILLTSFIFTAATLMLFQGFAAAQKKILLYDSEKIISQAKIELDSMMLNGALKVAADRNKIKGEYSIDITIQEKGKVLSVYMVSSDADDIKMQNLVKDLVKTVEFSFKLPKGRTQKFQHTFNFR